jgi:hypothetical protein
LNVAVPCPAAQSRLAILDGIWMERLFFPDRAERDSSRENSNETSFTIYPYQTSFQTSFFIKPSKKVHQTATLAVSISTLSAFSLPTCLHMFTVPFFL